MPVNYEESFKVGMFECDPWDRMTPGAALRRMQTIAMNHCESLGVGMELHARTHTVFLLSKVSLNITRMPRAGEAVCMETAARGIRRAVYLRTTAMRDAQGAPLCEADTRWVLVDTDNRRILRSPLPEFLPFFDYTPQYAEHDMNLPAAPQGEGEAEELRAGYTLCDRNGHVNNSRYADMVYDRLPRKLLENAPPARMLFHYRSEIAMGSRFALWGAQASPGCFYFEGRQETVKNFEAAVEF